MDGLLAVHAMKVKRAGGLRKCRTQGSLQAEVSASRLAQNDTASETLHMGCSEAADHAMV